MFRNIFNFVLFCPVPIRSFTHSGVPVIRGAPVKRMISSCFPSNCSDEHIALDAGETGTQNSSDNPTGYSLSSNRNERAGRYPT